MTHLDTNARGDAPIPAGLEIPVMLVMHMDDAKIQAFYKRLMKTRRREIAFGLNGRTLLLTRRAAIGVVLAEMKTRRI